MPSRRYPRSVRRQRVTTSSVLNTSTSFVNGQVPNGYGTLITDMSCDPNALTAIPTSVASSNQGKNAVTQKTTYTSWNRRHDMRNLVKAESILSKQTHNQSDYPLMDGANSVWNGILQPILSSGKFSDMKSRNEGSVYLQPIQTELKSPLMKRSLTDAEYKELYNSKKKVDQPRLISWQEARAGEMMTPINVANGGSTESEEVDVEQLSENDMPDTSPENIQATLDLTPKLNHELSSERLAESEPDKAPIPIEVTLSELENLMKSQKLYTPDGKLFLTPPNDETPGEANENYNPDLMKEENPNAIFNDCFNLFLGIMSLITVLMALYDD